MDCPQCGYVMEPWETKCPRCARLANETCAQCGAHGVVGKCDTCGCFVCAACLVTVGRAHFCSVCAPADASVTHSHDLQQQTGERPLPGPGFVWDVPLPGDSGWWGMLRRGWVFMRESLLMAFRDKDLIIPPLFSVIISVGFLAGMFLVLRSLGLWEEYLDDNKRWNISAIIVTVALAFIFYVIHFFFTAMTVHLVNVHLRGRDARLGPALQDALRNLGALLLLSAISAVLSLLTSRRRRRDSLLDVTGYVADAVQHVWTVATYLLLPIIILEDVSFFQAVARAKDIHARNLVPIVLSEVGVLLMNRIIGFLTVVPMVLGVFFVVSASPVLLIPALVGAGLWLALIMAYTSFVRTAYYTCLYLWAVERAATPEAAAIPLPLAAALQA